MTKRILLPALAAALLAGAAFSPAIAAAAGQIDLMSDNMGWAANGTVFSPVPGEKYVPVGNLDGHPFCGNRTLKRCGYVQMPAIGDYTNTILKPAAAAQMKKQDDEYLSGKQAFVAMSRCWPAGVPGLLMFTAEPTYYLQTPTETTILYIRGSNIRHVWMNGQHTKNFKPEWNGDSTGRYDGDKFIIDTIGVGAKSFVDTFGTPHSDKMHVTEEYRFVQNDTVVGNRDQSTRVASTLGVVFTVNDPETFTTPWKGYQTFQRHDEPISEAENICAENNDANFFGEDEVPVPQEKRPDF